MTGTALAPGGLVAPPIPDDLDAVLRRMRLLHLRKAAPASQEDRHLLAETDSSNPLPAQHALMTPEGATAAARLIRLPDSPDAGRSRL